MKTISFILCFLLTKEFLSAQKPNQDGEQEQKEHVIFISIDGFRPEFYLDQRFPAPHLQEAKFPDQQQIVIQKVNIYA